MALDPVTIKDLVTRFQELEARGAVLSEEYQELDREAAAIRLILSKESPASLDEAIQGGFEGQGAIAKSTAKIADRIIDALRKFDEPISPSKIAEIIGGAMSAPKVKSLRGTISAELTKLIDGPDAQVERVGRAKYMLKKKKGPAGDSADP